MDSDPIMISKRTPRSVVWKHFSKTLNIATCNYCRREFKIISGSTTNLRGHLMRHHSEYVTDMLDRTIMKLEPANMDEVKFDISTSSVSGYSPRSRRSSIWKHFIRDEERQVAACTNCKREYRMRGNTSNFLRHFICCHKMSRNVERKKIIRSPVWKHFVKSSDPRFLMCKLCKNEFKKCGNTSNLIKHLRRYHKDAIVNSIDRKIETDLTFGFSEEGANKEDDSPSTNFIWLHFKKDIDTAVCNYCSNEIKMFGDTSSLTHHLKTYHKEKIVQNKDKVLTNPTHDLKTDVEFVLVDDASCEGTTEATLDIDNFVILENSLCNDAKPAKNTFTSFENSFTAKQPYKSFVWKHFKKHKDGNTAVCIYCNEERKTSGNTSNLKLHLMRHHRNVIMEEDDEKSTFQQESGELFKSSPSKERCWSFVWNHFTKSDIKGRAVCNYCWRDINTTSGNTTSMKFHLEKYHPEKMNKEGGLDKVTNSISNNRQKRFPSFVWRHFDKSQTPHKAVCVYCKQEYSTSGNTTNLKDHLLRFHREELMSDQYEGRIVNEETDELANDSHMSESFSENEVETEDNQTVNEPTVPEVVSYQQVFPKDWCKDEENTEQREENEFSEHETGLDERTPKGRTRSFVWRHFVKSDDLNKAACSYCSREFNMTHGSTSNLKVHLIKNHREELVLDVARDEFLLRPIQKKRTSLVWGHFRRSADRFKAVCNHCQKEYRTYGNTTNLKVHLMRYHRNKLGYDGSQNPLEVDDEAESKKARTSFVWKHFRRDSSQRSAICNYCNRLCKTYGSTSPLRDHLSRCHGIEKEDRDAEKLEQDKDTRDEGCKNDLDDFLVFSKKPKKACKSFVWKHFTKSPIPWFTICNHCNKLYKTCGNTSNMRNHLMRHHQKEISGDVEIEEVEPNEESDAEINDDIFIVPEVDMSIPDQKTNEVDTSILHQKTNEDNNKADFAAVPGNFPRERSNKSFVWDHFIKDPFENKATCSHCKKVCNTHGNTTNMRLHLLKNHNDILIYGEEHRKQKHSIWNYFTKTDVRHRAACNYCGKEYNTCGNSTRLRRHLVRYHGTVIGHDNLDEISRNQTSKPEDGFDSTDSEESSVDLDFDETKAARVPQYVACNFCKKLCTIAGLKSHLMTCQKKEIQDHDADSLLLPDGAREEQAGKHATDGVTVDYEDKKYKIADNLGNEFVILVVA